MYFGFLRGRKRLMRSKLQLALCSALSLTLAPGVLSNASAADQKGAGKKAARPLSIEAQVDVLLANLDTAAVRAKLKHFPDDAKSTEQKEIWLACCDDVERRYEEAYERFSRSRALLSQPVFVLRYAANTYSHMQQFAEALKFYDKVLLRDKTFDDYNARGDCYAALGKVDLAAADYLDAAKILPRRSGGVLTKAASFYMRAGKLDLALKLSDEALARGGMDYVPAHLSKAACLERLGRWSEAADAATKAIELSKPGAAKEEGKAQMALAAAISERIKCYDKLGKKDLAAADRVWQEKLAKKVSSDIGF